MWLLDVIANWREVQAILREMQRQEVQGIATGSSERHVAVQDRGPPLLEQRRSALL